MAPRKYTTLSIAQWDEAAERNSRGDTYEQIAEYYDVSERAVATHLPRAIERRRAAVAASVDGTVATATSISIMLPSLPHVSDRKAATEHWRQVAWADTQSVQARLRHQLSQPALDAREIRALSSAAEALRSLIKTGREVLDVDRNAADEVIPELIIRELTVEEVAEIRQKQRNQARGLDLDAADFAALDEATAESARSDGDSLDMDIVEEGGDG